MGIINLLDNKTINLISAGEVVERPASVIKELLENAVDAGAKSITVEIKAGGASYMRVSDDGKGMSREDVLMCVKKHATSKIKNSDDLDSILTLGFRGEALAAISSVSRFEIVSKRRDDITGTRLELHGEDKIAEEETGCPAGTSVTVCDLFFNLPARRKFLKKPATETGVISQYVEKIALSHPEIAFKYIADGSLKFQTTGDSNLKNTIYAVYGRDFTSGITEVSYEENGIEIKGYIAKPEFSKNNRNFQTCFVNNRYVRAKSVAFAVDDAYKNYIFNDKYPCYVLFCTLDPHSIDVNVHPAKLEIKFSDERAVYSAVYSAVRTALQNLKNPLAEKQAVYDPEKKEPEVINPPRIETKKVAEPSAGKLEFKEFSEMFKIEEYKPEKIPAVPVQTGFKTAQPSGVLRTVYIPEKTSDNRIVHTVDTAAVQSENSPAIEAVHPKPEEDTKIEGTKTDYRVIGEVFNTYILVESADGLVLIDKHAAHERILYEELKQSSKNDAVQLLMVPAMVELDRRTAEYAEDFIPQITKAGFEISAFGDSTFAVRSVPAILSGITCEDISDIVSAMAQNIADGKKVMLPVDTIFDNILHTAACKAAIKAKRRYEEKDMEFLVKRLYEIGNITYCPHGRPVCNIFTKKELDKMFFRT